MKRLITLHLTRLYVVAFCLLASVGLWGQSTANYTFATNATGSLVLDANSNAIDMSTGTTQLVAAGLDANASAVTNIGFDFWLQGTRFTQFSVQEDGLMQLGSTTVGTNVYTIIGGTTAAPRLAAFNADMRTGTTTGKIHHKLVGTAPNRTLVVEFTDMQVFYTGTAGAGSSKWQMRLYESTGVIEYVYGAMSATDITATNRSPSIGFYTAAATNSFASVAYATNTSSVTSPYAANPAVAATGAIANLNSASDGSRRIYKFTPPVPAAATALNFTSVSAGAMTLNWTDNASNELVYAVYRSTDNVTFTYVTQTAANVVTYPATSLTPSTTYYWQIYAVTEGGISTALTGNQMTGAASFSGTKTIGTSGDYTSITAAIAAIQANGLSGATILELQSTYVSTVEPAFPVVIPALLGSSTINKVTIRPASGVGSALSITSANATGTMSINGGNNIVFDGRPGGIGTNKFLTIANTIATGYALQFINDASSNLVNYCTIQSVNTSVTSGSVVFSTTTGTTGNDNNTIDLCDITKGATTPSIAIYSAGTTTTGTLNNSGNTVSNCNISDFFLSSAACYGIYLASGTTDWTITANSLFQTATRTTTASPASPYYSGIYIATGNNHVITSNYIGGSAALASGTWTLAGAFANRISGIYLAVGTTTASSVQGNTIAGFSVSTTSGATGAPGIFNGIYVSSGTVNIGNTTGNTIGSSGTGSIVTAPSSTGGTAFGIASAGTGTFSISNNAIGGMTLSGSAATISASFVGINTSSGTTVTIDGNTIGHASTANSINANNASTGTTAQVLRGIVVSGTGTNNITNNILANWNNAYAPSTANASNHITGIAVSGSSTAYVVTGNTIRNMALASSATGTSSTACIIGIAQSSTTGSLTVSSNFIHSLSNTNASSAAPNVIGIYNTNNTAGTLAKNQIYGLSVANAAGVISGIQVGGGTSTYQNNMIRLGIDVTGAISLTTAVSINGINETLGTDNFYFNSVYIGGTGVGSTATSPTYAFNSTQTTNTRSFQNNVFVNARSNTSTGSKHYAVRVGGSSVNPGGLTNNYNLYYTSGTGAVFGFFNSLDVANIAAWRTATGQDANSAFGDPNFTSGGTGSISSNTTYPLKVTGTTPIEGSGLAIGSVTDDIEGETRSSFTPTDIGADAGNYTASDIFAPSISYTALGSDIVTASRTLTSFATITDNVGVSSTNKPRLYYKKSTEADAFVGNTTGDNGWKYVVASNSSSPYSFVLDYTLLTTGTTAANDIIQYFVVAQDDANNLGSFPSGATASGNPPVTLINGKATTPSTFTITASISGIVNVGAGQTYTTLTATGGLFAAINGATITGNITANIVTGTTEDGANALNQWSESGAGNYTLTIQPSDATTKLITGAVANGMIRLNGADRVTIDGRSGGSGRFLTFRNTNTSNATLTLLNDATNNTIRSSVFEGATTASSNGVIFLSSTAVTTGNSTNTITDNQIRDRSDVAGVPANLIYSQGFSNSLTNKNNIVSNNEMFNFTTSGILTTSTGNEAWTITGNTIYEGAARTTALTGINLNALGTNTISQNTVRDLNTSSSATGISIGDARITTISRNKIHSIPSTSGSTGTLTGILFAGASSTTNTVTITNNQISIVPTFTNAQTIYGIRDFAFTGNSILLYYNSVYIGGTASGSATWAYQRGGATPTTSTSNNNIFFNNRTGGSVNHYALGDESAGSGTFAVGYNLYAGTGVTAANYMDRGTSATPVSFSAWATAASDATSWADQASAITAANLFTSVTAGSENLNINTANAEAWYVNGKGMQIASQATDYGGSDARSVTVAAGGTDIGSDEMTPASAPPSCTATPASPAVGNQVFTFAGRTIATINWISGTLPTTLDTKYYSGTPPPSPAPVVVQYINAYTNMTATGGSGFTYDITMNYDDALLGTVTPEADFRLSKRTAGIWQTFTSSTTLNTTANTATVTGLTSFSDFTGSDVGAVLPVELINIKAIAKNSQNYIDFTTANEVNLKGFQIERSATGTEGWSSIGELKAKGAGNYTFIDATPLALSYYRVRSVDFDGKTTVSKIVSVNTGKAKLAVLNVYPSPTKNNVTIDFNAVANSNITVSIKDITGRLVLTKNVKGTEGVNNLTLDVSNLSNGLYIMSINDNVSSIVKRIVKQ